MRWLSLEFWKITLILLLGVSVFFLNENLLQGGSSSKIEIQKWSEKARLAKQSLLLDITATPNQIIAVGERGHVLLSTDQGEHWTQPLVPTRSLLTAITVVNRQNYWIVGHNSVILHSPDSGTNWIRQNFQPQDDTPLFDVWFKGIQRGIAIGAYGLALETNNGGENWNRLSITSQDPHLYAIQEDSQQNLYIVGEFGSIFRSSNLGRTWHTIKSPYAGTFFGVLTHSQGTLLVFGLRGTLFRSENAGKDWQKIKTGTGASLFNGIERNDGSIIIVGSGGTIIISQDLGKTFKVATPKTLQTIAAIAEIGKAHLLAVGQDGITHYNIKTGNGS